jgi:hypothetical protein
MSDGTYSGVSSLAEVPTYTPAWVNPPPVTSGTTTQSYTDLNGEVWVAKNGVNAGQWRRARDVLHAYIYRAAALNLSATVTTIAYDTVTRDTYGMYTGASNYGFAVPIPGWYVAQANIIAVCTAANAYIQGYIYQNNTTIWSSDNYFSALASGGGLCWRTAALMWLAAGDIVNCRAQQANGFAVSAGSPTTYMTLDYMGSG